jgi:Peptidase S46
MSTARALGVDAGRSASAAVLRRHLGVCGPKGRLATAGADLDRRDIEGAIGRFSSNERSMLSCAKMPRTGRMGNQMRLSAAPLAVLLVVLTLAPASADEGMWTLDAFPAARVEKTYGFAPDQAWLDHVRLSSVRLARGCSASFVSPLGLVQTNHHCARDCIAQLSTRTDDLVEAGFYAKTAHDERKCPDVEVNQLTAISDVTARVNAATAGRDGEACIDAKRAVEATIAAVRGSCCSRP